MSDFNEITARYSKAMLDVTEAAKDYYRSSEEDAQQFHDTLLEVTGEMIGLELDFSEVQD